MRKRKKTIIISILSTILVFLLLGTGVYLYLSLNIKDFDSKINTYQDTTSLEYQENIDSISSRFPKIEKVEKVYWKGDYIGAQGIGPTDYFIRAFIKVEDSFIVEIKKDYEWIEKSPEFPKGIDSKIIGSLNFSWNQSVDFETEVLGVDFGGNIYVDFENQWLYVDVVSH